MAKRQDAKELPEAFEPGPPDEIPEGVVAEPEPPAEPVTDAGTDEAAALAAELDALKDRHLRLAAEFDNFRRRTARERLELRARAQADLVAELVDELDDLGRVADLDPATSSARDIIAGIELVERKVLKQLEAAGLERIAEPGVPFDPQQHEAIGAVPAERPEDDHTVATILQVGYRFGGQLLRPARVQVRLWSEPDAEDAAAGES